MKHDDAKILQEIQRNTEMGMTAIETILDKIEDDDFSLQLSKQSLRYSEIHNKALDQILENKGEVYHGSQMIQGSSRGITSMWKAMKHNRLATDAAVELAQELVDFEQKNIERLKEYL